MNDIGISRILTELTNAVEQVYPHDPVRPYVLVSFNADEKRYLLSVVRNVDVAICSVWSSTVSEGIRLLARKWLPIGYKAADTL